MAKAKASAAQNAGTSVQLLPMSMLCLTLAACSGGGSSSGGAVSYWMPFEAQATASGGTNGLFLVASNNKGTAPVFVNNGIGPALYLEQYLTDSGNNITQTVLSRAFYFTLSGVNDHLYSLDLSDTSSTPAPVQIGSLTIENECNFTAFNQTLNAPSTAVILIQTPGNDGVCYTGDDVFYLAHVADSTSTPPTITPIAVTQLTMHTQGGFIGSPTNVWPIDDGSTGNLDGLLYIDKDQNLTFSDQAFAHPQVLLAGVSGFSVQYAQNGFLFVELAVNGKQSLYRVSDTGAISQDLYDFQASNLLTNVIPDSVNGNLWIADNGATGTSQYSGGFGEASYSINLIRVPFSASSPASVIYSTSGSTPGGYYGYYEIRPRGFIGSNLVFTLGINGISPGPAGTPAWVDTLSATASQGSQPNVIGTLTSGLFNVGRIADGKLFLNEVATGALSNENEITVQVLDVNGNVLQSFAKSQIVGFNTQVGGTPLAPILSNPNFYIAEGSTGTPPDLGGATVFALSASSFYQTVVSLPNGSPYVLATDEAPALVSDGPTVAPNYDTSTDSNVITADVLDTVNNVWIPFSNPSNTQQQPLVEGTGNGL